mgnify:CR=1 FL=1|jgi:uncharacterized protein YecT (DUF1311 family)
MIKKITVSALIAIAQLSLSSPAYAVKTLADCQQADLSMSEISTCLDKVIKDIDLELETWVNQHIFNLEDNALTTGRNSALTMFKRSQSNYVTFRKNNCQWKYLAIAPKKGANIAYKKCYIQLSQTRIKELSAVK